MAGEIWKGDILVADIEELENMDGSEIRPRRLNAKEVLTPQRSEHFIFPVADGTAQISGRDHEFREHTPRREQPVRSEDLRGELQGELEGFQPTKTKDDAEARRDFWSIQGDFIYRHNIEHPVQLHAPKEETFPIPLKYIDVTRSTYTNLDVLQEKRIDDHGEVYQVHGRDSRCVRYETRNFLKDTCGPGGDFQKIKQVPDLLICGLKFGRAWQYQLRSGKNMNGPAKTKAR